MKLKYVLLLALLIAAATSYFLYQQKFTSSQADVWSFVPEDAILVYETQDLAQVWESFREQTAGSILTELPGLQAMQKTWNALDSTSAGNLSSFLEERAVHASLHVTGKNSVDYLFYLPITGKKDRQDLEKITESFRKDTRYRYSQRSYHKVDIHEFTAIESKVKCAWLIKDEYLIGSFTPFLVEDVIRGFDAEEPADFFKGKHPALFQLAHVDADAGDLYVNGARFKAFLDVFHNNTSAATEVGYPLSAKLDIALNEDGLLLNGYALPEDTQESIYLQSLQHEKPRVLGIDHLLPVRTAELYFYGFGQGEKWHQKLAAAGALPAWKTLLRANTRAADLPAILGERVALASLQTPGAEDPHQLLFLHTPQEGKAAELFQELAASFNQAAGDSLYQEEYSSYTIAQLAYPSFPEAFLGPAFKGFEETFYLQMNSYVILSNSMQALKSLIVDVEGDNTWRKSLPLYGFLAKTNQEMNFGYYVNIEKAWKRMVETTEPDWRKRIESHGSELRQFKMLAMQLSALDEMFYASILLQAVPQDKQELESVQLATHYETTLEAPLVSRPMLSANGNEKSPDLLVQDSLYQLYVLDNQGSVQKVDSLGEKIVGDVFQLEMPKQPKLDYLAVGTNSLHRYGPDFSIRPGFPVALPEDAQPQWVTVIDYNGSKVYRILLASHRGDLFMYDLEGNLLEGWQPRPIDGALSAEPGHLRVRGKDFLYAFQQKGIIHMMNRRGEPYKGFPLNLQDSLLGPVHFSPGADLKNTLFTTVTKGGELVTFNLEGRITHQEQLYMPGAGTSFMIVPSQRKNEFLIVRQSRHRLSLLDSQGNMLFEKDYLTATAVEVQYYHFGVDKELIAITDPEEEFTYLYDVKGNLLNFEPLNSCCPISVFYQEQEDNYLIYKSYNSKISALKGGK